MLDDSLAVNDVGGSVGNTVLITVASVGLGDLVIKVGNERDVHVSESSFLSGLEGVLHV